MKLSIEKAIELSAYTPLSFGDDGGYSALHRPGSWEWALPHAHDARNRLYRLGYVPVTDTEHPWRVEWWHYTEQPGRAS